MGFDTSSRKRRASGDGIRALTVLSFLLAFGKGWWVGQYESMCARSILVLTQYGLRDWSMTQSKSTATSRARAALCFASALVSAAGGGTDLQMYVRTVHHGQSGLIHAHYNAGCFRRE